MVYSYISSLCIISPPSSEDVRKIAHGLIIHVHTIWHIKNTKVFRQLIASRDLNNALNYHVKSVSDDGPGASSSLAQCNYT